MSGYPPSIPFSPPLSGIQPNAPYSVGNNSAPPTQPYLPYPPNSPTSYPSQSPYPAPYPSGPPNMMSGDNSGYPGAAGYPTSPGHPNTGGYPNSGGYPNPNTGGYPNPNTGGYPSSGGYPNSGYVSDPGANKPASGLNPQVCPTAPDLSQMQKIPGYEQLTFDEAVVMPPSLPAWQPDMHERKQLDNLPSFTEEEVKEAVLEYTGQHCCYGSDAAKNMVITNITMMSAFHYKLETFGEKRESAWRFEPYRGQPIDGPMNGPAPQPWDVHATPPQNFKDSKLKMEVPHTAFVKPCHTCVGNCRVRCDDCQGNGTNQCTWCKGRGVRSNFNNERCDTCEGTGFRRCTWCSGSGQKKCKTCDGKGQLKGYVELIVTWTNHVDDYISETSKMPRELVRSVTGQIAFEEENPRVYPISHSSDQAVNNASHEYVNKHSSAFPNERILKQKHNLRLIPIGEVNYTWKDKSGLFYVYGYEHKVHFENYPQKCCCTIM